MRLAVAKVGGSLLDLPDLRDRLRRWLESLPPIPVLLVAGGGPAADLVRTWERLHGLTPRQAHWEAIQAMSLGACLLSDLMTGMPESIRRRVRVIDPVAFCQADQRRSDRLEESWRVSSDSIAARVAARFDGELWLLKSVDRPSECTWDEGVRLGLVDETFPAVASGLRVHWVNLRSPRWDPNRSTGGLS